MLSPSEDIHLAAFSHDEPSIEVSLPANIMPTPSAYES